MNELEKWNEAPDSGCYLIYTRKNVLIGKYNSKDEALQLLDEHYNDTILESHFFNNVKEYRNILSKSRCFHGYIEHVADFKVEENDVFVDSTLLDKEASDKMKARVLKVLNKVSYDNNGMAFIDDYRLVMEAEV